MKRITLITFIFAIFTSIAYNQNAGNTYNQGMSYYQHQGYQQQQGYQQYQGYQQVPALNITKPAGKLVKHTMKNPETGLDSGPIELPANWKITKMAWVSPNGAKAEVRKGGSYATPQYVPQSVDQIIQQELSPKLQQYGAQVKGIVDLPQLAQHNQAVYSLYWKAMPMQDFHQARGIDLIGDDGKPGFIIVHFTLSQSQYGAIAHYYMNTLSGESTTNFEKDKNSLLYALATAGVNRQAIALHNQREQQKSQASWAAHNSRMRSNQRNFDNWQRTQSDLSSVNDIYFEGWKSRNQIENRMQEKTVNGIWERDNATNPYTRQTMQVQNGYKYYYMNSLGEYFGTNDEFYNPAMDPNMNHVQWKKVNRTQN